jgi:aryl-alcohol dehydrogenase-like predicted oxidoreductase
MDSSKKVKSNTWIIERKSMGYYAFEEENNHNLPRVKTIQNPYSLLNRLFENASSEICAHERRFVSVSNGFCVVW